MSFRQPFTTFYKPGDLIYGMGASIAELAEQIIPGFRNRTAKEKLVKLIRVSEYLMTDAEFQGAINDVKKLYGSRWDIFRKKVERKTVEIQQLMTGYRSALQNHPKYKDYLEMTVNDQSDGARVNQLWRRKSKGGLHYACFFSPNDIIVHYCLDGIDLDQVITKSVPNLDLSETTATKKQRGVTGSEIRWIYRNRYIPNVRERIQFWKSDGPRKYVPCTPPWEWPVAEGGDWSQYIPTNVAPGADFQS